MYRLELPIDGVPYVLTGQVDDSGKVLLDIAVHIDDDTGPVSVGSLAAPPSHLTGLARALPRVLRDLAQTTRTHRPRRSSQASSRSYQDRLAATKAQYPNAYTPWDEAEEQRLQAAFSPDAPDLTGHLQELAASFKRQPSAIRSRLVRLGLLSG